MRLLTMTGLALFLVGSAGSASAVSIGVFADPSSASCNINAPQYVSTTFYINAVGVDTRTPPGITGAEFQVINSISANPADVAVAVTPNPAANVDLGNPMTGGCNIAFAVCQNGPSVNLYTVTLLVVDPAAVANQFLSVAAHTNPTSPNYPGVIISGCDAPCFCVFVIEGGGAWLNSSTDCTVAVEARTWSEVKTLFH